MRHLEYPRDAESTRPFRLLDAKLNERIRYRYYSSPTHAYWGTLKEMLFADVGTVIHVFDTRNSDLLAIFKRLLNDVHFEEMPYGKKARRKEAMVG